MNARPAFQPAPDVLVDLLGALYEGPLETEPWADFVERLRVLLDARIAAITLHHPQGLVSDTYVLARDTDDQTDWGAVEDVYRRDFMENDPARLERMAPGSVVRLEMLERVPGLIRYSEEIGIGSCLRAAFTEPGGMRGWIDVARALDNPESFATAHVELLQMLQPHFTRALTLYATLKTREAERGIYEDTIDHFALGTLLLDGELQLIRANRVARKILDAHHGLEERNGRLHCSRSARERELQCALHEAATASAKGLSEPGALLRLDLDDAAPLGVLIRPLVQMDWFRGAHVPSVVVYLADPVQPLEALRPGRQSSRELVERLFGLTPQEARLALLLADGCALAEAARQIGVAESAARNYSKRIYAKIGIGTRSELVRMLHRSLALLG